MNNISQTTFSNFFSSMKMFEFRLKFHWSLLPRVQLTIFQHWFRCLDGVKPLSEPMMVCLPTHICVTRPQWVKQHFGILKHLWTYFHTNDNKQPFKCVRVFSECCLTVLKCLYSTLYFRVQVHHLVWRWQKLAKVVLMNMSVILPTIAALGHLWFIVWCYLARLFQQYNIYIEA